jgi:hypothetical protein
MSPLLLFLLLGSEEVPFEPSVATFADAAACRAHLTSLTAAARGQSYAAVEGPYDVGAGDVRVHLVRAEGSGHVIAEHRCLADKLSARSWTHAMEPPEEEFTVESVARTAEWLKKGGAEKQQ